MYQPTKSAGIKHQLTDGRSVKAADACGLEKRISIDAKPLRPLIPAKP